jgi:hypothetical protein
MRKIIIVVIMAICILVLAAGYIVSVNKPSSSNNQSGQESVTITPVNADNSTMWNNTEMPNNTVSEVSSVAPTTVNTNEAGASPDQTEQTGDNGTYSIGVQVSITKNPESPSANPQYDNNVTMILYKIIPSATTGYIVSLAPGNNVGLEKVDIAGNPLTSPNAYSYNGPGSGPYYQFSNVPNDGSSYLIEVESGGRGWYIYPSPFHQSVPQVFEVNDLTSFAINNTTSSTT